MLKSPWWLLIPAICILIQLGLVLSRHIKDRRRFKRELHLIQMRERIENYTSVLDPPKRVQK